jgi:xanthine dehydrogenase accessory factor
MKEIEDILRSFEEAQKAGKRTALATVVHVEGSSYRRPGARMLITEDGHLTGAISGGCLEGDALRKALLAIDQQQNKLVTYDTSDEEDAKFGVQLGCNGIVHILFEPIISGQPNPLQLLQNCVTKRQNAVLITLFSISHSENDQPGTSFLYLEDGTVINNLADYKLFNTVFDESRNAISRNESCIKDHFFDNKELSAFIEFLKPSVSLVIAGAGNDAIPLMDMAHILGWHITVTDGRPGHATKSRFSKAQKVLVAKPHEILQQLHPDPQTVFVLMTHNYNYDLALFKELIHLDTGMYIGTLGPKKKLERMINDLNKEGIKLSKLQMSKIFGPVGLDIGAETSEEIALSIMAEINAVLAGKQGGLLRDKKYPIHYRPHSNQDISRAEAVKE